MKDITPIWLSAPHLNGEELKFIQQALESNWIAPIGPNIDAFELSLEKKLSHGKYVTALNSGTSAIHLALKLAGVSKNDEVICQNKTFVASVNPVLYLEAKPIFVDSEQKTWNICPDLLEKTIEDRIKRGKKPKAILIVCLYGMPYNTDRISDIAKKYNIIVIEDSAEALGSSVNNRPCGTFGDYGIFSFNGNKIITTSAGGALITKNKEEKQRSIHLSTQAKEQGDDYTHSEIGYNYRMSNICAGIGRGQLTDLQKRVSKRREIFKFYYEELRYIDSISFLNEPKGYISNRWLTCIVLENQKLKTELLQLLNKNNVEARSSWKPMHMQPLFKNATCYLNGFSEVLYNKVLCLPSGNGLSYQELSFITSIIKSYFK